MPHQEKKDEIKLNLWANEWLRDVYGLDDEMVLNAGEVEELLQNVLYDFLKEITPNSHD